MSDDRLFDAFRTFDRRVEPAPDFADRLLEILLVEAGLITPNRARARWRSLRLGPVALRIPAPWWRMAVLVLVLLALLTLSLAIAGALLRREEQPFTETTVRVVDITAPVGWSIDTLASEGDVGAQPALAVGMDGMPVVAYFDRGAGRVRVARCADPDCSALGPAADAGAVVTNLWSAGGYLAAGPGGEVWVARTIEGAGGTGDLQVEVQRICPDPAVPCEAGGPTNLGPGFGPLIRVRADGRPVVVFGSAVDDTSRVVVCGDAECKEGNTTNTVAVSPVERDFVLTPSGRPLLVTSRNESMELLSCLDDACTRTRTTAVGTARQPRIQLDPQGRPVITALAGRSVVLYHCANADCSGGTRYLLGELGAPPPGEDEIVSLELVIGRDSRPYISMGAGGQLQLFACSTSACPEATRITLDATSPALAAPHALGLDADGLPFVLYGVRSDLQVAGCLDASCLDAAAPTAASPLPTSGASPSSSSPTPTGLVRTAVDPAGGINPAVTVGIDGLPVAVYAGTDAVSVMRCGDPRCASGNTIATVPYGGAWGGAVTVGPSGLPVLAALDFSGNLSVVRCNDAGCTDASVTGSLDGIFADFAAVAVVVPEDDRPLVAYQEGTSGNGEIRLARCTDPSCSGWAEAAVDPNPGGSIVNSLELRLGGDGEPVLGYALANGEARIARCSDLDCSGVTVTTAGTKGNDLTTAALGIGSDGTPALAFYSDGSLLVARCGDATCASVTTVRVDEATAGWWTPIGVGFDERDFPIISYWSPDNRHKKLALCNDVACESAELIEVEGSDANGADDQTAVTFLADGSPVYVYHRNGLFAEVCTDPRCGG